MKITREIKIALFGLIILFAAYWGVNFLKGLDVFSQSIAIKALYEESDNIEVSSPVLIKGVKVGSVTEVNLNDINKNIEIVFTVKKKFNIPSNSIALISNKSMLGGKAIVINIGDSKTFLEKDDFIEGKLDDNVTKQINELKGQIYGTISELTMTLKNINEVLNEQTINDITSTLSNVNTISGDASLIIKDVSVKLEKITTNLTTLTDEFCETTPHLKASAKNLVDITATLKISLPEMLTSVTTTVDEINGTVKSLNDKKGTFGMMLNDRALYDNLETSTKNLSDLLFDMKKYPSRYVKVSVFGRKDPLTRANEKEQKKELKRLKKEAKKD